MGCPPSFVAAALCWVQSMSLSCGGVVMGEGSLIGTAGANAGVRSASQKPKSSTEAGFGQNRTGLRSISKIVVGIARSRWPFKTASELAIRAEKTQRQAEAWLDGAGMGSDALANLIASDMGLDIIKELVGERDAPPTWFRDFKLAVKQAELKRRLKALQAELEQD